MPVVRVERQGQHALLDLVTTHLGLEIKEGAVGRVRQVWNDDDAARLFENEKPVGFPGWADNPNRLFKLEVERFLGGKGQQ